MTQGQQLTKEQQFFNALKNIFIGVPVEGESGYINLMRMKAKYFEKVMMPAIQREVEEALRPFPEFREELFDKLYTFFKRYFTQSGSIGFLFTPYHQSVYERVYTNEQDVVLFWKTARLYYVKTDRLFRSMEVQLDGFRFFFDVSALKHKRASEKRELVFEFKGCREDGAFVFTVTYSEKGKTTKVADIRRAIKDALGLKNYTAAVPSEETLEQAFRLFERQSEVDYFICKDARSFLREQFDLWLWQYVLGKPGEEPQTEWTETRIRQLKALKRIAYKVIDYIAAFEDELVKIWNKPKFVLRSGYVITLDRIAKRDEKLLGRIVEHLGFAKQLEKWKELGMVEEDFTAEMLWQNTLAGKELHPRYRFLPLDTKYFKDLELQIIGLFDDLDAALDGWLIKSENYQALNTILPKFKEKVQTIYIDPPFNKEQEADYFYSVKYKDSTWITMLENRLRLAKDKKLLKDTGSIFVRCDYNGNMYVRMLMNEIFGEENFRNEIVVKRGAPKAGLFLQFENLKSIGVTYDNIYWFSIDPERVYGKFIKSLQEKRKSYWTSFKKIYDRPTMQYELLGVKITEGQWMWKKERAVKADENYKKYLEIAEKTGETLEEYWERTGRKLEFIRRQGDSIQYWVPPKEETLLDNNWLDIPGYSSGWGFKTENSEILLKRVIESTSNEGDLVMDFFLGSGTTTAVAHKLKRKWIGVEMGEHFYTVVLPRMKKVLFYDKSGISKEKDVKEKYNENNAGGFFKYYELEQYEDVLRRASYADDADLFSDPNEPVRYLFLRDTKMLDNAETGEKVMEVDLEKGTVKVDLSKLYREEDRDIIDLAETLSNLTGKWIKRIHPDPEDPTKPGAVEFQDGTKMDLKNPDWRVIKPLIWW